MNKLEEIELKILREAVDEVEIIQKKKKNGPEIETIVEVVEEFLRKKKLVCYGGTAINNILPDEAKFYDRDLEIPDYDFFSSNALSDAKELADIYSKLFDEVEAKAGVHYGTYKVFVNYIPVADITQMDKELYNSLSKNAISIDGIKYTPPNFLRMALYLELSRPYGDTSRWEKILKRLILLNKYYPLKGKDCLNTDFQRGFENKNKKIENKVYEIVRNTLINQGVVFFGSLAHGVYANYMSKVEREKVKRNPDFDVLSLKPENTAIIVKEQLEYNNINNVNVTLKKPIGEVISKHYEISIGDETVCFIYEPLACHSYNIININKRQVKIATIDTMLSFYLAFQYADRPYYDENRILCMSEFLFKVQQRNRLQQKGVLRRFSISCYGEQATLEDMREEKTKKYKQLFNKKNSKEYDEWFLRYIPSNKSKVKNKTKSKSKTIKKNNKTKKNSSILSRLLKVKTSNKKTNTFKIPLY